MFIPGLYIIPTPIGNAQDITLRALEILKQSNYIFCEDTRITDKLLSNFNVKGKLKIYNDYSTQYDRKYITDLIKQDQIITLVSDAGTPLISDPGFKLVQHLRSEKLYIDVLPGPCSIITALVLSGFPTDRFTFLGFAPKTPKEKFFKGEGTIIFFDTAKRIQNTLSTAHKALGNREICIAREITKKYQECIYGTLDNINIENIKGEIVVLINEQNDKNYDNLLIDQLKKLLNKNYNLKTAVEVMHVLYSDKYHKTYIYNLCKKIKENE